MAKIKLQEEIGFKEFNDLIETLDQEPVLEQEEDIVVPDEPVDLIPDDEETDDGLDDFGEPKKETRTLYVTNKDLLAEIHKSKMSHCEILDQKYFFYDAIVETVEDITPEIIEEAKARQAKRLTLALKAKLKEDGAKITAVREAGVTADSIQLEDLTFRVMSLVHVPKDPNRKRKGKGAAGNHVKTQFLPFTHHAFIGGTLTEVARSHWIGDFQTGKFTLDRGQITNNLAKMFMMLVDRYSRRSNWRSYTYLDEMKNHALVQLIQIGLQFNEAVGDNPFAFYTTSVKNCFTRMLNLEKKNQNIRDDILIMCGSTPSFTRQNDEEHARAMKRENARLGIVVADPVMADDVVGDEVVDFDESEIETDDQTLPIEEMVEDVKNSKIGTSMIDDFIVQR